MSSDTPTFTHFDQAGNARMVDVSAKADTNRVATAQSVITMSEECFAMVAAGTIAKGDVLAVARLAGIMAAKRVDSLIPLTHPLPITKADVAFQLDEKKQAITIEATVGITGKTGVEMEALTAATIAALTIYDMCKAVDKRMEISDTYLLSKSGGKSGTFRR
ncbi:MAG: cyclic pyranopterin monophosphate synthase MoaC [Thermodesulfobacteriota bacterium]